MNNKQPIFTGNGSKKYLAENKRDRSPVNDEI